MADLQNRTVIREQRACRSGARIELENGISFAVAERNHPIRIGRADDCDICIPSGHVSRHHCELYWVNGVLCLKDTSSNGTVIEDRVIRQESVSIQSPTSVVFAGQVMIRIVPVEEYILGGEDRRRRDRRSIQRRRSISIVDFDRRYFDRRSGDRRISASYS